MRRLQILQSNVTAEGAEEEQGNLMSQLVIETADVVDMFTHVMTSAMEGRLSRRLFEGGELQNLISVKLESELNKFNLVSTGRTFLITHGREKNAGRKMDSSP